MPVSIKIKREGRRFYVRPTKSRQPVSPPRAIEYADLKAFVEECVRVASAGTPTIPRWERRDSHYWLRPLAEVKKFVRHWRKTVGSALDYTNQKGDCDDFALAFHWAVCEDAWKDGVRRTPYAAGIVHGHFKHVGYQYHACNIWVPCDGPVQIIEPQKGTVRQLAPGERLKFIYA